MMISLSSPSDVLGRVRDARYSRRGRGEAILRPAALIGRFCAARPTHR
jgi:hypothetical protein